MPSVVVSMERSLNRCVICVVAVTDGNLVSLANSIMVMHFAVNEGYVGSSPT